MKEMIQERKTGMPVILEKGGGPGRELFRLLVDALPAVSGRLILLAMVGLRPPGKDIGKIALQEAVVEFDQPAAERGFEKQVEPLVAEEELFPAVEVIIETLQPGVTGSFFSASIRCR